MLKRDNIKLEYLENILEVDFYYTFKDYQIFYLDNTSPDITDIEIVKIVKDGYDIKKIFYEFQIKDISDLIKLKFKEKM